MDKKNIPILPLIDGASRIAELVDNISDPDKGLKRVKKRHIRKVLKNKRKGKIHIQPFLDFVEEKNGESEKLKKLIDLYFKEMID